MTPVYIINIVLSLLNCGVACKNKNTHAIAGWAVSAMGWICVALSNQKEKIEKRS